MLAENLAAALFRFEPRFLVHSHEALIFMLREIVKSHLQAASDVAAPAEHAKIALAFIAAIRSRLNVI